VTARVPKITAITIQTDLTILLKSRNPLPVTVIAPAMATTAKAAEIILMIFKTMLFLIRLAPSSKRLVHNIFPFSKFKLISISRSA
jgi:hypothetical protein